MQELHANVTAEHRAMHEFDEAWHATITPHQEVRAELAAWPHGVFPLRMMRSLGADLCSPAGIMDLVRHKSANGTLASSHHSPFIPDVLSICGRAQRMCASKDWCAYTAIRRMEGKINYNCRPRRLLET